MRELDERRRHLEAVLDVLPVGVWIADRDGRLVARNEAGFDLWGGTRLSERPEEYGEDYRAWGIDGRRLAPEERGMARAVRDGETSRAEELEIETASGERRRILNYAAPILDDDGEITGGVTVNVDITAQRAAEASGVRQRQVLAAVGQGVAVTDLEGRVTYWNPAAERLLGWPRAEVEGRPIVDLAVPEDLREQAMETLESVRRGEPWRGELEVRRKDGSTFPGLVELSPIRGPGREVSGLVGLATDLTAEEEARRRRDELVRDLVAARRQAEAASRAKSEFLAAMSHELRTPLNAVIGYADLLEAGLPVRIPGGAVPHLRRIRLCARHLHELIEEVLQVSRLEAGREGVERATVELEELFDEVRAVMQPLAEARGLDLRVHVDPPDRRLVSDPRKLRQILVNLVGNAIGFTDRGGVEVRAEGDGDGRSRIRVEDTGIGIAPHEVERLFEPFWQADREGRRTRGAGLGLAITRRLVEVLGGTVDVESRPGEGSVFTVTLPNAPAPAGTPEEDGTRPAP